MCLKRSTRGDKTNANKNLDYMDYVEVPFVSDLAGFGWSFMCCSNMLRMSDRACEMFSEKRCTSWKGNLLSLTPFDVNMVTAYRLLARGLR